MIDDPCDFCPAFLSETEMRVMDEMTDGEVVYPASYIAGDLDMPVGKIRSILRRLRDLGLARWGNLTDDNGQLAGRGTWLNGAGCALQTLLRKAPDPVDHALERGWFLEIVRLEPGNRGAMAWAWSYVFRGRQ